VTVIQIRSLGHFLSDIRITTDDVLTTDEVDDLHNKLLQYTDTDGEKQQKHLAYINEQKNSPTCPRCGANLVVRTAKKGENAGNQFYGCSNYPKCNYTRSIM